MTEKKVLSIEELAELFGIELAWQDELELLTPQSLSAVAAVCNQVVDAGEALPAVDGVTEDNVVIVRASALRVLGETHLPNGPALF